MNYENKGTEFHLTVKANLRTFMKTVGYDIDETGKFLQKNESKSRASLSNDLSKIIDPEETFLLQKQSSNPIYVKLPKYFKNCDIEDKNLPPEKNLDAYLTYEICKKFGFPIEKVICNERITPEEAEKIMEDFSAKKHFPTGIIPLPVKSHDSYFGEFYGYTIDHNPMVNRITPFKLHIYEKESNKPVAEYSFYDQNNKKRIFTGYPYLIADTKSIAIEMTEDNGSKYQYLYFNGKAYNAPKITYKSGVCVRTSSASKNDEPDIKSFILTGTELSDDIVKKYIPGLLKITGDEFYILRSDLEKAEISNPEITAFRKYYEKNFVCLDEAVYMIEERRILGNVEKAKSDDIRINAFECLTELKTYALAADRVTYRNAQADYNFFKDLCKKQNTDKNQTDELSQ